MVDEDRGPGPGVSDTGGRKDRDRALAYDIQTSFSAIWLRPRKSTCLPRSWQHMGLVRVTASDHTRRPGHVPSPCPLLRSVPGRPRALRALVTDFEPLTKAVALVRAKPGWWSARVFLGLTLICWRAPMSLTFSVYQCP